MTATFILELKTIWTMGLPLSRKRPCVPALVRGEKNETLLAIYNFLHWRTRRWHVGRTAALFVSSAATWGEILISLLHHLKVFFFVVRVSADDEVTRPRERRYCMERLRCRLSPRGTAIRVATQSGRGEPVGRKQETNKSQWDQIIAFNNNIIGTNGSFWPKHKERAVPRELLLRLFRLRGKVQRRAAHSPVGSSPWPIFHWAIMNTFCPQNFVCFCDPITGF